MECVLDVATNENQTSSSAFPIQPASDWVALVEVAVVVDAQREFEFTETEIAPEQLSFEGGDTAVAHKPNVPLLSLPNSQNLM